VFVDVDVLVTRTPFCWLAMLRDETDGAFRLHTSADTLAAATREWQARHPGAGGEAPTLREQLLRDVLDEVTADGSADDGFTSDEFLCLVDDEDPASVRAVTLRRQVDLDRRREDGIPSLSDALVAAGCPTFAARVAAHLGAPIDPSDPD
jgi:hypothetical protein